MRFLLLAFFLGPHASAATVCGSVPPPALPAAYRALPSAKLEGPEIRKLCAVASMPWCERVWLASAHPGVAVLMGSTGLDAKALGTASRARFLAAVGSIVEQLKPRYRGLAAAFDSRTFVDGTAVITAVTAHYVENGTGFTDDRTYLFYTPECRIDLLVTGPDRAVAETVAELVPAVSAFRGRLAARFPAGIPLSAPPPLAWSALFGLLAIFVVGLTLGRVVVRARDLWGNGEAWRKLPLKAALALSAAAILGANALTFQATRRCVGSGGLDCAPGAPESYNHWVMGALMIAAALHGLFSRRARATAGMTAALFLQQCALAAFLTYSQGLGWGIAGNLVLALLLGGALVRSGIRSPLRAPPRSSSEPT